MKASEILRALADKLDNIGSPGKNRLLPVDVDNTDHAEGDNKMIPPLQQKMELLKKAAGVESEYDDESEQPNDLDIIKRNAGMPVAIQVAAEDNDVFEDKK